MKWLSGLLRPARALDSAQAGALAAHRAIPRPDDAAALDVQRWVVVDVEASGLDPAQDQLISIGAVGVRGGRVRLEESFETLLRQDQPSVDQNILVHHIGGAAQLSGREPADALLDFLAFSGKDPFVAFHADFDRLLIERAMRTALGYRPENAWLDLALLAPALLPGRAAGPPLDDWLQSFGIENHDRHNAVADALSTAQLLLVVLAEARRQGLATWSRLLSLQKGWEWLGAGRRI
jgi:DNA polymerase III subunit epsilon